MEQFVNLIMILKKKGVPIDEIYNEEASMDDTDSENIVEGPPI